MSPFAAVLRKDLRLELRGGNSTLSLVALSLMVMAVMVFTQAEAKSHDAESAAAAIWIAMVFSGVIGATRVLTAERENGCIRGLLLCPIDPAGLYAAKLCAAFIFMAIAEAAAMLMMVLFFNLDFGVPLLRTAPILMLGALGFAAAATLLAAISSRTRAGDMILPILAVPIYVPALIAGVRATAAALGGAPMGAIAQWLKIMVAFDILLVTAGCLLFEYAARED
ncbi:MAG TPA: heme exporter protein CcmB [Candidatus Binataceae bacterium]|nr:heme exporter protein CcmB [Candidatus Binataceae bacterium]